MGRKPQSFALLLIATLFAFISANSSAQSDIVWYRDGGVANSDSANRARVAADAGIPRDGGTDAGQPLDGGARNNNNPDASFSSVVAAAASNEMGVWCGYFISGGIRRSYCSPLKLKDAQAECDKKVSADFGFKTECSCTDDKAFLGDRCKGPDAGVPQDDTRLLNP